MLFHAIKCVSITQRIVSQLECKYVWDKKYPEQKYIMCIFDKTLTLGSSYYKNKCNIVVQIILLFVSVLSNANLYFLPRMNV